MMAGCPFVPVDAFFSSLFKDIGGRASSTFNVFSFSTCFTYLQRRLSTSRKERTYVYRHFTTACPILPLLPPHIQNSNIHHLPLLKIHHPRRVLQLQRQHDPLLPDIRTSLHRRRRDVARARISTTLTNLRAIDAKILVALVDERLRQLAVLRVAVDDLRDAERERIVFLVVAPGVEGLSSTSLSETKKRGKAVTRIRESTPFRTSSRESSSPRRQRSAAAPAPSGSRW